MDRVVLIGLLWMSGALHLRAMDVAMCSIIIPLKWDLQLHFSKFDGTWVGTVESYLIWCIADQTIIVILVKK